MPDLFKTCPVCQHNKCWRKAENCEQCGHVFTTKKRGDPYRPILRQILLNQHTILRAISTGITSVCHEQIAPTERLLKELDS